MEYKILLAGFGGQGVLFLGKVIAQAAINLGMEASWLPSYGPEMRGGTANCRVVISDDVISSPFFSHCDTLIAMNQPSLNKFVDTADEYIFTNSDSDNEKTIKIDCTPCNAGNEFDGSVNMVMLGAFLKKTKILPEKAIYEIINAGKMPERNIAAMEYGMKTIK